MNDIVILIISTTVIAVYAFTLSALSDSHPELAGFLALVVVFLWLLVGFMWFF